MIIPPGEKIIETKKCLLSGADFIITDKDWEFYDKISPVFGGKKYSIPGPTLCPDERQKRRLSFRNERKLYKRKCDKTGIETVGMYAPESPLTIYDQRVWWSDDWSPFEYGRQFDFWRWFFEQFGELMRQVPLPASLGKNLENSDFTLHSGNMKNCYLVISTMFGENLLYGYQGNGSKNCLDFYHSNDSEYCYQVVDTHSSYNCQFCKDLMSCRDCQFCYDCKNCTQCLFCSNLRGKEYCINNKQLSPEEYQKEKARISLQWHLPLLQKRFLEMALQVPHQAIQGVKNENCIGDYLNECGDCFYCFNYSKWERLRYISTGRWSKDGYDCNYTALWSEWCYECLSPFPSQNSAFSTYVWDCTDGLYLNNCHGSQHLFGCSSLKKVNHCILNKSYSTQEYETLCGKIINHMRSTGEWWEFFPHHLSPFGYNETVAQEYFPMTEEEVKAKGWNWHAEEDKKFEWSIYHPLPISQYDERIVGFDIATRNIDACLNGIVQCEVTGKPFKIIKQELAFYIENSLPIPTKHPDQRHKERMDLRNPRTLYERTCSECRKSIITTYAPERPEKVVCEECYKRIVY